MYRNLNCFIYNDLLTSYTLLDEPDKALYLMGTTN